jgi:DNA-directed RNA polymerase specialized sigma24 family protein
VFTNRAADSDWDAVATLARGVASRYVPPDRAEDVAQDVCICLLKYPPASREGPLVQAIARKLALSLLRGESRRLVRESEWARTTAREAPLPHETRSRVDLPRLSGRCRLLAGMLAEGFTVREIAERTGRPRSSIQREIEALRSELSTARLP